MNEAFDTVKNMVESGLFNQARKTEDELRKMIRGVATLVPPGLSDEEIEQIAREIEHKQGIKAGLGAVVDSEDFEPWLDDATVDRAFLLEPLSEVAPAKRPAEGCRDLNGHGDGQDPQPTRQPRKTRTMGSARHGGWPRSKWKDRELYWFDL
jgi:hypothetical protein